MKNNSTKSLWKTWSKDEQLTWQKLATRQFPHMTKHASHLWLNGANQLQLTKDQIPDFETCNQIFKTKTAWNIIPTQTVFADGQFWFETLAKRDFIITQYIRPSNSLDYTPMPDMFHDCFGHLPFLIDTQFTQIIDTYSKVMLKVDPETRTKLGHIWWYTVEFGLIEEQRVPKILGAGIASSFAEMQRVFSGQVELAPFDPEIIGQTKEHHHQFHDKLFVLKSLDQLQEFIQQFV